MLDLTTEAKQAWLAQTRQVSARITIGTTVYNADKIMSVEYDSGSISGETFQIGSFYQNSIKVVLVGILESLTNDNKVKLEFAVKVGSDFVWTNMGTFYVSEFDRDRNSNRTTFTAVDGSAYLGSTYNPTITFPNSLKNLVTDIANQCGVKVNFASMTHLADENVTQPPSKYTCRQVISMVAQIHGGFARMNRNDELEVTRLMSTDLELNPSQYLLKGLVKNETTYRTDGIIVKTGDNDTDKIQVGTVTGSAVINLENPLMTQQLLDTMWRTVSTISYYPFTLKWRGVPNLEAGDWITIVDKQGTRFRVPNLSYKLSFKGGLSATSSADTTATSNVQHRLRGTLTQRVEDVEGYINASGGRSYTGLDVPDNEYLKKGDTWYKPDGDDTAILVYDGEKWEEVASPEVFRKLQADFDELDRQAKEAFEQVDTLVQESPETKRLAQEAQEAVNLANQEITKLQTSVSDTKTALENAEQEFADSLATTTRELTAKISGIDVGGRNLIFKTGYFDASQLSRFIKGNDASKVDLRISTVDDNTSPSGKAYLINKHKTGTEDIEAGGYWYIPPEKKLTPGKKYTWSIYVRGEGTIKTFGQEQGGQKFIELTDSWTKISHTFIALDRSYRSFTFYSESDFDLYFTNLMLEEGTIPTSWSPAPEDFESDLSNTSIELSTKITESAAKLRTEMGEKYSTKNDLTALSGEYNSFKEQTAKNFSQQVSSIQTIQTDTTEAQKLANDAFSKANSAVTSATNASSTANSALTKASDASSVANSASQNATNAAASANSAVSTANTAKSNADKAIADVAALTKTVSSQSTRIDQTSNRIDLVANGITEVGNKLDNLQVGGRNLLYKTGYFDTSQLSGVIGDSNKISLSKTIITDTTSPSGKAYRVHKYHIGEGTDSAYEGCFWKGPKKLTPGNKYTWSIYVKGVGTMGMIGSEQGGLKKNIVLSDTWTKINHTFTANDGKYHEFVFYSASEFDLYFTNLMLEEGNTPTTWSPAPEDTQDQIDGINSNLSNNYYQKTTVDSKLSTAVSGITAQYTKDINTKLGNYYDKSTIDSKLTIDGQGIATYVKNTQSKLDNLQVGGTNLIKNTSNKLQRIEENNVYWRILVSESNTKNFNLADYLGKRLTIAVYISNPSVDSKIQLYFNVSGWKAGNIIKDGQSGYSKLTVDIPNTLPTVWNLAIGSGNSAFRLDYKELKAEIGDLATSWSPAPEDMATLTQYTEVKQLADRISSTVYDSASGLVTKTTQLAGKYAIQNLNSYGDVLSSLNLNGGNVRIKGGLIDLDGNVRIQDAFVTNLKANSILANEITAQATTVVNAKIANLDAGVITTGILKGTNLSLNLGTGDVQFKKGRIQAPNNTLDIQVDTGIMKVLNTNGEGVTFQNGNLYFSNATEQSYFGSLIYNNQLFSNAFKGVSLIGKNAFQLKTSNYTDFVLSYTKQIGSGISASPNGMVLQSDKRVNIIGGQPSGELTTPAMVSIGTAHGSYSSNGNGVTIDGYSDGIYLRVVNGGKISMFGDVEFITGTITGPIVKSTDFSVKNMAFVFSMSGSYINVETSFGTFKLPVSS